MARARKTDVESSHEAAATVAVESDAKYVLEQISCIDSDALSFATFTQKQVVERLGTLPRYISDSGCRTRISELR